MLATTIGSIAAFLTTICFVPQAIKVIRTNDTHSLSLWMYSLFTLGVALWLIYGVLIQNMPIIMANSVTLILASVILTYKIRSVIAASSKS